MTDVNEIVIARDNYKTAAEFREAVMNMFDTLMVNDYICRVYQEIEGIYIIQYSLKPAGYGGSDLVWIAEDEYIDKYVEED